MADPGRVLAVILGRELYGKLAALFDRATLDVSAVTSGKSSLVLLRNVAYDLILVEHPLPDLELADLLAVARRPGGPCERSPLLLVTHQDAAAVAAGLDDPRLEVVPIALSSDQLQRAASSRLGVAAREASRLLVQLEVEAGAGKILRACQSVNLSETGMLLRTSRPLPLGTRLALRFSLPEDRVPIECAARVMRHAAADAEGLAGMGVAFEELRQEDRQRLADFVEARITEHQPRGVRGSGAG